MKIPSQTIWSLVAIILLLIVAGIISIVVNLDKTAPWKHTIDQTKNSISYACENGKSMTVQYASDSASISLSDGRTFDLAQVRSGSGTRYEGNNVRLTTKGASAFLSEGDIATYNNCVAGTIEVSSQDTLSFTDSDETFTFIFPTSFSISGGGVGMTENWRQGANNAGTVLVTVHVPKSYMPNTNFSEAKLSVGTSGNPDEVAACLTTSIGTDSTKTTATINGVMYTRYTGTEAGAGNIYETTSYRTIRDDQCYVIEYIIHSTNIGNYDPSSGIAPFDKTKITTQLEGIITTFQFLS